MTDSIQKIMKNFRATNLSENYDQFLNDVAPTLIKQLKRSRQGGQELGRYVAKVVGSLEKLGFEELGRGSFRAVFVHKSRPDVVLKVAYDKQGFEQNLAEIRIGKDNSFRGLFPRVYESDPAGAWYISERVDPVDNDRRFHEEIVPELSNAMSDWDIPYMYGGYTSTSPAFKATMVYVENYVKHRRVRYNQIPEYVHKRFGSGLYSYFAKRWYDGNSQGLISKLENGNVPEAFRKYVVYCYSKGRNKFLEKIWTASLQEEMQVWDIRAGNVGISFISGEPILLDSGIALDFSKWAPGWTSRDTADVRARNAQTKPQQKSAITMQPVASDEEFEIVRENFDWENDPDRAMKSFIFENNEARHVDVVLNAIQNLRDVLHDDKRFIRIKHEDSGDETDVVVFLNAGQNNYEIVAQVALDKHGYPIDDGSAWIDTSDFKDRIQKYAEKLDQEKNLTEEDGGGGDGGAVGSGITSGEGTYEPLSTRGNTYWTTKKNRKNSPAGTFTSKGGNKYKTY